jgi:ABC-type molybdenum transport system ATPase subunit/photorepair protein PhrA
MYIKTVRIENYKSFGDPQTLNFSPGMNIITGQNNAGKTALLEAIHLDFQSRPHLSQETVPQVGRQPHVVSTVDFWAEIGQEELRQILGVNEEIFIPVPVHESDFARSVGYRGRGDEHQRVVEALLAEKTLTFKLRRSATHGGLAQWRCQEIPSFGIYPTEQPCRNFITFRLNRHGAISQLGSTANGNESQEIGMHVAPRLQLRIYRFTAERFNTGKCKYGPGTVLNKDASNLPEVLNALQANTARFRLFNEFVRQVLPQVQHVSIRPLPNELEILIWNLDPTTQRIDLAVPLTECGTGIGQVLAILYVVLNADHPQVLLVDEPQSFLHPGAARKLIEVLRQHPRHQYVVSSHSPAIISAAQPEQILVTRLEGSKAVVQQMDANQREDMVFFLSELGARLSDVFGSDNILWVEGRTEEICFTEILRSIAKRNLLGTSIVGVRKTGDFEARDAETVFDTYMKLSEANALIPPAIGFVFDKECRPEKEREDLVRKGKGLVAFLPRRMYENYLLLPTAVAAVANAIEGFREHPLTAEEVAEEFNARLADVTYYCEKQLPNVEQRAIEVNGARILKDVFAKLSDARVTFDKLRHSVALTDWIIKNDSEKLREIKELLIQLLDNSPKQMARREAAAVESTGS